MANSKTTFKEKDLGYKHLVAQTRSMDDAVLLVGLPGRGSPKEKVQVGQTKSGKAKYAPQGITVAELGVIHEFGSKANNIPARPFMAQTYQKDGQTALDYMERQARVVMAGKMDARTALNRVGLYYVGRLKNMIRNGSFVENKPATIALKGSSKPLIDTGLMRNSITHVLAKPDAKGTL